MPKNGTEDHRSRNASGCRRIPKFHREECLVGKMYLEGILDTRERIIKITNQFRIERQIRKGIGRAGVLRQACRQEQTKERWGKLAEKHVEREAWLETHKETK